MKSRKHPGKNLKETEQAEYTSRQTSKESQMEEEAR